MDPRGGVYDYEAIYHRKFDPTWRFPGLQFTGSFFDGGYRVDGRIRWRCFAIWGVCRDRR